ncbi:MAG: molybdopterin-dependent oxidoreductase [Deltaproteobacteria bacterium]
MDQSFRTICDFCHASCGMLVQVRDGRVVKVKGDPDNVSSKGFLCKKGADGHIPLVYHKDRVTAPLLRTKTGFQKVSWKEALDFASDRLLSLRKKHGPQTLVRTTGAPYTYEGRDGFVQLLAAFGSIRNTGMGHLCSRPRQLGVTSVFGEIAEPDYNGTKLAIFWGANVVEANRYSRHSSVPNFSKTIPMIRAGGGKIVVVDPIRSETVALADQWVPLKLGTDLALALAMIHVILEEELYDFEFVQNYTIGFDPLKNHIRPYTPEWAAGMTGLPAEQIRNLARQYATEKPAILYDGNGLDMHTQCVETCRALGMLIALTGNLDRQGANVIMPWSKQNAVPTVRPPKDPSEKTPYPLFMDYPFPVVIDAILSGGEDRPTAMIVTNSNPALALANSPKTRLALEKLDLLIVNDHFLTATAERAHLVLPDASGLERWGYRAFSSAEGCFFALRRKVIEPLHESRPVFETEYALAQKMGLEKSYPFTNNQEWIDFMVKPSGISFADLKEKQVVYTTPPVQYEKFRTKKLATPSGKVELFSKKFEKAGYDAIPLFKERKQDRAVTDKFPLNGTSRKPGIYSHTKHRNIPEVSKHQPEPFVWMHPVDAKARGIENGSWVEVESPRGKIELLARTGEAQPIETTPGVVIVDFGWGNPWDNAANINVVTDDQDRDPISSGTSNRLFPCQVRKKEPSPQSLSERRR